MAIQEFKLSSKCGQFSRRVWYLPGASHPERFCVFLDGEYYVHHMDAPALMEGLQQDEAIPPVACLFVSHQDGPSRHQDFTCNDAYAEFIARDLVNWLIDKNPEVPPSGHVLGGTSLSGLQATYTCLRYRDTFDFCLSQSGSFWWNHEWLKTNLPDLYRTPSKHWISVGDQELASGISHPPSGMRQEIDQITAAESLAQALQATGSQVHYHLYQGGHEIFPWKKELPQAIQWLIGRSSSMR